MATPMKYSFVEEVTDDLHDLTINTPCGKKKQATVQISHKLNDPRVEHACYFRVPDYRVKPRET